MALRAAFQLTSSSLEQLIAVLTSIKPMSEISIDKRLPFLSWSGVVMKPTGRSAKDWEWSALTSCWTSERSLIAFL